MMLGDKNSVPIKGLTVKLRYFAEFKSFFQSLI